MRYAIQSSWLDLSKKTIWRFYGLKCFHLEQLKLGQVFYTILLPNSIIEIYLYPLYTLAKQTLYQTHILINNSEGFTNEFGDHRNMIKNICSYYKTELGTIIRSVQDNMGLFAREFVIFNKYNSIKAKEITQFSRR